MLFFAPCCEWRGIKVRRWNSLRNGLELWVFIGAIQEDGEGERGRNIEIRGIGKKGEIKINRLVLALSRALSLSHARVISSRAQLRFLLSILL